MTSMINEKISCSTKQLYLRYALFLFLIAMFSPAFGTPSSQNSEANRTLHLASTSWCPYICDNKDKPGFIVEYLTNSLADRGIHLAISILPWSRAIYMAQTGALDGLATATTVEAPDFFLTRVATGSYQMCFFSRATDNFSYNGRKSLANKTIGAVKDYGYGEPIDSMILQPKEQERIELLATSNPLYSLMGMLETSRIDLFIEDAAVVQTFLYTHPNKHSIQKAGCLNQVPFYTAISPTHKKGKQLAEELSIILSSDAARDHYSDARKRYGLEEKE